MGDEKQTKEGEHSEVVEKIIMKRMKKVNTEGDWGEGKFLSSY